MTQEQFQAQMRKFNEELTALNAPIREKQHQYETEMGNIRISIAELNARIDHGRHITAGIQEELHAHKASKPKGEGKQAEREAWGAEHQAIRERLCSQERINLINRDTYNQAKIHLQQLRNAWYDLEKVRQSNAKMIWNKQHALIIANPKDNLTMV